MRKTVKVTKTIKEETTMEVEFPIYRHSYVDSEHGDWQNYYRLDAEGMLVNIQEGSSWSGKMEYQIQSEKRGGHSSEFYLGEGYYCESSKEVFDAVVARALAYLHAISSK